MPVVWLDLVANPSPDCRASTISSRAAWFSTDPQCVHVHIGIAQNLSTRLDERHSAADQPADLIGLLIGIRQRLLVRQQRGGQARLVEKPRIDVLEHEPAKRLLDQNRRDGERDGGGEQGADERARPKGHDVLAGSSSL